jgi:hypothetical protein
MPHNAHATVSRFLLRDGSCARGPHRPTAVHGSCGVGDAAFSIELPPCVTGGSYPTFSMFISSMCPLLLAPTAQHRVNMRRAGCRQPVLALLMLERYWLRDAFSNQVTGNNPDFQL